MTTLWPGTSNWPDSTLSPTNHTLEELTNNSSCVRDDEGFKFLAYTVTYLLVFPIGFLSNSGALFVFLRLTPKWSASHILMTNLALSDTLFSLTLPLRLTYYFNKGQWDLPDWTCRLCVYCFYVNLYTSVLLLTGMSMLRWLAVIKPLQHRALATPFRASLVCFCIWLFVGVSSVPFLFSGTIVREGKTRCFEPTNNASWNRIFALNYVAVTFGFLIPFITILGCYGSIICKLTSTAKLATGLPGSLKTNQGQNRIQKHEEGRRRRRNRSLSLVAMVICTFLLCFLPYHVARSLHLHAVVGKWDCVATKTLQHVLVVTLCLAAANSVMNPVLYYCAGESFRTTVRRASLQRSFSSFSQGSMMVSRLKRRMSRNNSTLTKTETLSSFPLKLPDSLLDGRNTGEESPQNP
ncbi:hypothetical protein UPYG_G00167190 [Umbra pygmaea]|uniref:G-protein coupled receptors family 1 profile domain-containing protein n=1 Tax=Umbra pygmaea TaxID=75934 RepID=A0ABD0WMU2_UMBPY